MKLLMMMEQNKNNIDKRNNRKQYILLYVCMYDVCIIMVGVQCLDLPNPLQLHFSPMFEVPFA